MDWETYIAQAGLVFLKEGLSFVFSSLKDKEEAEEEEDKDEKEAQVIAMKAVELKSKALPLTVKSEINWDNVGTLFWFGNDLMWIQDMMFRGAMPERVLQGINHAMEYAINLGFGEKSLPVEQLTFAKNTIEALTGIEEVTPALEKLIPQHYGTVYQYVNTVKWYINSRVEEKEPGFKKLRAL